LRLSTRGRARFFHAHAGLFPALREDRILMLTGATAASELRLGLIGGVDRIMKIIHGNRAVMVRKWDEECAKVTAARDAAR
jgi:hypothetical protein